MGGEWKIMSIKIKLQTMLSLKNPLDMTVYFLSRKKDIKIRFCSKVGEDVYSIKSMDYLMPRNVLGNDDCEVNFEKVVRMSHINYQARLRNIAYYRNIDNMLSSYIIMYKVWFPAIFHSAMSDGANYVQIFKDASKEIFTLRLRTLDDFIIPELVSIRLMGEEDDLYVEGN